MTVDRSKRCFLSVNFTVLSFKKPLLINFIVINSKLHLFSIISKAIIYLFIFQFQFFFYKTDHRRANPIWPHRFFKGPRAHTPKIFQSPKTSSYPHIQIKWSFPYSCHVFAIQILSKIAERQSQTKNLKDKIFHKHHFISTDCNYHVGGGWRRGLGPRETTFSQQAKRSPSVVVRG